jgi:photosystem II stability/assembly factor-like uncharacterized protein
LNSICKKNNVILIGSNDNFIIKCINNCDSIKVINSPVSSGGWSELSIVDSNIFFLFHIIGSNSIIYKTEDGGISWIEKLNIDTLIGKSFEMLDKENGILFCSQYYSLNTTDGGDSWILVNQPSSYPSISSKFSDSIICIGSNNPYALYFSKNKGQTWQFGNGLPYQPDFRSIFIYNSKSVYTLEISSFSIKYMSFSFDEALTWNNKQINIDDPYDVIFTSFSEGYVVGFKNGYGTIMKTVDTGNNWIDFQTTYTGRLGRIIFLNDSIALISGTNGYLAKWNKNSLALSVVHEKNSINNNISILPNPANIKQSIHIQLLQEANIIINLQNSFGQYVKNIHRQKHNGGEIVIENEISDLANGVYFYEVIIGKEKQLIKIIKN